MNSNALLEQTNKQLEMWMAIDDIRDKADHPRTMLADIVALLADEFQTSLCLLAQFNPESGELELEAVTDRDGLVEAIGKQQVQRLAERAAEAETIQVQKASEIFSESGMERSVENLEMAAVPVIMGPDEKLGALLLLRNRPFTQGDVALLAAAESQIDSAIIQGQKYYQLHRRNKELEIIYSIDRLRDNKDLSFRELLDAVLHELHKGVQSAGAFIMLSDQAGAKLEVGAVTDNQLLEAAEHNALIVNTAEEALKKAELVYYNKLGGDLRSIICYPLIMQDVVLGVFGVTNSPKARGFDMEDRDLLDTVVSQATISLQNASLYQALLAEKERIIQAGEEAQKELATDLHDGPAQDIAAIAMSLQFIHRSLKDDPEQAAAELEKVEEKVHQTADSMRYMLFTLRPLALESQGLVAALEELAARMQETFSQKVTIEAGPKCEDYLDSSQQRVVFDIIAEATNNASKHAEADLITIRLNVISDGTLVEIQDDGGGFDLQSVEANYESRGSYGMLNLHERVERVEGKLHIATAPGKGTQISVLVPLMREEKTDKALALQPHDDLQ
jgi:signal transduction histidine kinase